MKPTKSLLIVGLFCYLFNMSSCQDYLPGFDFELFKNTPAYALAKAVERDDTANILKLALVNKINIDYQEQKFGNTLLMLSIVNKKNNSFKTLLKLGANPNLKNNYSNNTAFLVACDFCDMLPNNIEVLSELIHYGAVVNSIQVSDRVKKDGTVIHYSSTPLIEVTSNNCNKAVRLLVENGADINKVLRDGYGAITYALLVDNLEAAKYFLIEKKANIPEYCLIRNKGEKNEIKYSHFSCVFVMLCWHSSITG